MAVRKK